VRIIAFGAIIASLAAGCGTSDATPETTGTATTAPGSATGAASEPYGEYERDVAERELEITPGQEPPAAGTWHLSLGPTVIQVVDAEGFRFSQELTVSGDTLEIERYLGGDGVFCDEDGPSSYRWKVDGDELTLSPRSEECPDRESILDATWRRAE
jgi:hypothetical protein